MPSRRPGVSRLEASRRSCGITRRSSGRLRRRLALRWKCAQNAHALRVHCAFSRISASPGRAPAKAPAYFWCPRVLIEFLEVPLRFESTNGRRIRPRLASNIKYRPIYRVARTYKRRPKGRREIGSICGEHRIADNREGVKTRGCGIGSPIRQRSTPCRPGVEGSGGTVIVIKGIGNF